MFCPIFPSLGFAISSPQPALTAAILLVGLCGLFWLLNLVTLPGNWLMVAAAGLYFWMGPAEAPFEMSLVTAVVTLGLAIIGEVIEFLAGAVGAQRAGASRRSTIYAVIGSMVGALGGAALGIPIPIVGPVIAAILFGGLGATAGAMYGERGAGQTWKKSWSIGQAAFWGRTLGTIGKTAVGLLIWAAITAAVFV